MGRSIRFVQMKHTDSVGNSPYQLPDWYGIDLSVAIS